MSRKQKRYDTICRNHDAQYKVKFNDLKKLLEGYGFEFLRSKGSHYRYTGRIGDEIILETIPRRDPVKKVYVKLACSYIKRIRDMEINNGDSDKK
jgi:predicted RNA binding protein YcfA (HicA-like mRNA interferase family)